MKKILLAGSGVSLSVGAVAPHAAVAQPQPFEANEAPPVTELPPDDPKTVDVPGYVPVPEKPETSGAQRDTAAAADAYDDAWAACQAGWGCAWTGGGYTGPIGRWSGSNPDWSVFSRPECESVPSGTAGPNWKDCASSAPSRRGSFLIYADLNQNGQGVALFQGDSIDQLSTYGMNNDVASNY